MAGVGDVEVVTWNVVVVPKTLKIVSTRLLLRDIASLLLLNRHVYRTLISCPSLWLDLDLHEMNNAGERLVAALSLQINLEFAQDIEDMHFDLLKSKCLGSMRNVEVINLNGCQKISDKGIEALSTICPKLKDFSMYWNVRVTDTAILHLVGNCKCVINLNLSGCKNISDRGLILISETYSELESLNITRCTRLTDCGMRQILHKCCSIRNLNLYALSGLTDDVYTKLSPLTHLRLLDLCGAQNLSDRGLSCLALCKYLVSLNLTWCVRVTDEGVIAVAQGCIFLEFLSLFGIVGITDKCLEALAVSCPDTLTTLDIYGCVGIKRRKQDELLKIFPRLRCFKVHS